MSNRLWGVALFGLINLVISSAYAAPAAPVAVPAPIQGPVVQNDDTDGKGTIGLICIDSNGNTVTWRDAERPGNEQALRLCMARVIEAWNHEITHNNVDVQDVDFDDSIEGHRDYQILTEGLRWSQQIRRLPLPIPGRR
jgi:hypothetical protein